MMDQNSEVLTVQWWVNVLADHRIGMCLACVLCFSLASSVAFFTVLNKFKHPERRALRKLKTVQLAFMFSREQPLFLLFMGSEPLFQDVSRKAYLRVVMTDRVEPFEGFEGKIYEIGPASDLPPKCFSLPSHLLL